MVRSLAGCFVTELPRKWTRPRTKMREGGGWRLEEEDGNYYCKKSTNTLAFNVNCARLPFRPSLSLCCTSQMLRSKLPPASFPIGSETFVAYRNYRRFKPAFYLLSNGVTSDLEFSCTSQATKRASEYSHIEPIGYKAGKSFAYKPSGSINEQPVEILLLFTLSVGNWGFGLLGTLV